VRLYQFSDDSVIWKRGSLLRKNEHLALLKQLRGSQMMVLVQGEMISAIIYTILLIFGF